MVKALTDPHRPRAARRIVIVDDDEVVTGVVACVLRGAGYPAEAVSSSEDALRIARERPPALLITDVRMPGIDGFDLCAMLKDHPRTRRIPVVFLSGFTGENDHTMGRLFGGAAFIDKPFSAQALLLTVGRLLKEDPTGARMERGEV
jgi:CheY-like chemotaxis protein